MKRFRLIGLLVYLPSFLIAPTSKEARESYINFEENYLQHRIEVARSSTFTTYLFYEYMDIMEVPNRDVVIKQAFIETGFFTSRIFIENNNLFGMKLALVRETTAVGRNRGHAVYNHWTDSIDDYILWYEYFTRNREYNSYYDFLADRGYAEDPYYINKLKTLNLNIN